MNSGRSRLHRLAEPLLLTVLTVAGLVVTLVGDETAKCAGVVVVALPLLAILRHAFRSLRRPPPLHIIEEKHD